MEPFGGAGILWLPANTKESKQQACAVVYESPHGQLPKRPKRKAK
jgi:hypothetical protein